MAGAVAVGDILAIIQLCQELAKLVADIKDAPTEYESFVHSLNSMHATFSCVSEAVQCSFAADSQAAMCGQMAALSRLLSEIASTRSALLKAGDVLKERYAKDANSHLFRALFRKARWSSTRQQFEARIRGVHEHMGNILALTESLQLQRITKIHETVAALELQLNNRSPAIGLPGSGGIPQDHVRVQYGLGTTTYLQNDICSDAQKLHGFLEVMFSEYPGKRHIAEQHYRLFSDTNSHQPKELTQANWSYLVDSGSSIFLAFIVGTWQMSCVNFCPGCNRKNPGEWHSWRNCQCGCSYFISEAGEVDCEPVDGFWTGKALPLKDYKDSTNSMSWEETNCSNGTNGIKPLTGQHSEPAEAVTRIDEFREHPDDELYFRCMIMVYDPIFNYVCRNVFCRCILGASSLTSNAPPIDILCALACPNHARSGVRPMLAAVTCELVDYTKDPYFDKFGGYETFIQIARYLNQHTIAICFVDFRKLCPDDALDQESITYLIEERSETVLQYRREVLSKLRSHWQMRMEARYEGDDPEFVSVVEDWMADEENDLAKTNNLAEQSDEVDRSWISPTEKENPLVPCLRKGRLTLENLDSLRHQTQYVPIWPWI